MAGSTIRTPHNPTDGEEHPGLRKTILGVLNLRSPERPTANESLANDLTEAILEVQLGALDVYGARIHENSNRHGFWPKEGRNFAEMLMLVTSELAEALEEDRSGKPDEYFVWRLTAEDRARAEEAGIPARVDGHGFSADETHTLVQLGIYPKPEGRAVELADALIRILDTLYAMGVNITDVVTRKMAYNSTRPYKHGKGY